MVYSILNALSSYFTIIIIESLFYEGALNYISIHHITNIIMFGICIPSLNYQKYKLHWIQTVKNVVIAADA